MRAAIRHDWSVDEIRAIYEGPLLELVFEAARVHRQYHDPAEVQVCKLVSIKTGGCAEDCGYCSQSSWYETGITPQPLMDKEERNENCGYANRHKPFVTDVARRMK